MFGTIVIGTDDSPSARRAVRVAGDLARRYGVDRVHVVTGYDPIPPARLARMAHDLPAEFKDALSSDQFGLAHARSAEAQLLEQGVAALTHPVPGGGTDAIVEVARDVGADLVVVGSRHGSVLQRLLHGSVSTGVVHRAPCAVLVVHDEDAA